MPEYVVTVPHCVAWCAAVVQSPDDMGYILQALASGVVMACVLLVLFFFQERYRARRRRSAHAGSVLLELDRMREKFWKELGARSLMQPGGVSASDLPRSIYDGLVSSAAISTLSDGVQRQLAELYELLHEGNVESVRERVPDLMTDVGREKAVGDWRKELKRRSQAPVVVFVKYAKRVYGRLKTLNTKPDTATQLYTRDGLVAALKKPGFLVVKKRPGGRSRIHKTSCKVFWFENEMGEAGAGLDKRLGRGKARQEYYYCETWDDAIKRWDKLVGGEPKPCTKCRPGPEGRPE